VEEIEKPYCLTSGLSKESAKQQVSILPYCMDEDAEAVLATTRITDEDSRLEAKC